MHRYALLSLIHFMIFAKQVAKSDEYNFSYYDEESIIKEFNEKSVL